MAGKSKKKTTKNQNQSKNTMIYVILIVILIIVALFAGRQEQAQQQEQEQQNGLQIFDGDEEIPEDYNFTISDAEFQVHVIDVGQGDSILIMADGKAMLIDAAESKSANKIISYLQAQNVTELEYAATTHLHADHIGGYPKVMAAVKPKTVIESVCPESILPTTQVYEKYLKAIEASGAKYQTMKTGDTFTLGNANITVLAPISEHASSLNNTSLVLRVQYDDVVCIFTGDMELPEEKTLVASSVEMPENFLKADFLKAGHHGSDTSSGEAFLAEVQPKYVGISCGVDNKYGHPAQSTLEHLRAYTDEVHITAEEGDVVFLYDADTKQEKIVTSKNEE